MAIAEYSIVNELLTRHSKISKTCRIIAYCLRFSGSRRPREPGRLIAPQEMLIALQIICKSVQGQAFFEEYEALCQRRAISASSGVLALSPFISEDGLMRVGGRLAESALNYDARHPILLPRNHVLTQRIIRQEHERNAHAGLQATMAAVRQRYWPISLRSTVRKIIRNCVTCFKARPAQSHAIMAPLPAGRVTPSRPFTHCGVDYAGPFTVRESKRRNARTHKAYLAICMLRHEVRAFGACGRPHHRCIHSRAKAIRVAQRKAILHLFRQRKNIRRRPRATKGVLQSFAQRTNPDRYSTFFT
ncbi:uncharacterized protein [Mycetomoellerius zeteki]|uniref:uncharacterized protein n=1 Tax=Mycetomoellerius zeteki TaxID=64791 RepID=UPI00084EBF56|nr:PREDICTED: uncharacterized protein LOC108725992 [Trachymyrmex zeteki]